MELEVYEAHISLSAGFWVAQMPSFHLLYRSTQTVLHASCRRDVHHQRGPAQRGDDESLVGAMGLL